MSNDEVLQAIINNQQIIFQKINEIASGLSKVQIHIDDLRRIECEPLDQRKFKLTTKYPLAESSADHIYPRGTSNDDTRYCRFVLKMEKIFKKINYLDLGCAGGGMVFDFLSRGHNAFGVEGSNFSLINARANWKIIPNSLDCADITKPFTIANASDDSVAKFNVITAWEVMEHIPENLIDGLLLNIHRHLSNEGLFICSIATFPDFDPVSGAVWHVTIQNRDWWLDKFKLNGFKNAEGSGYNFQIKDYPRGSGNINASDWDASKNPEAGFHLVLSKSV